MKDKVLIPEYISTLSPREYLKTVQREPQSIKSVRIVPPKLGERGFGRLVVKWKYPKLRNKRVLENAE